jgi:hypothetical protein
MAKSKKLNNNKPFVSPRAWDLGKRLERRNVNKKSNKGK